jgi:ADP-ribose pyrophosphatase YjhB (NUDIX family)
MKTVVCVGAVVIKEDKVLLVRQAAGHSLEGQWTIPWGRLNPGESPSIAAVRETREESGVLAGIQGLLGVQELPPPWQGQVAILFLCKHQSGLPVPDYRETDAADYFTEQALARLSEPVESLSAWLGCRVLQRRHTLVNGDDSNPFRPAPGYL